MNTDKTTDTASQGLIDWAAALAARTDQGSLNWRVETSLLLGDLAAAKSPVAPAPDSALREACKDLFKRLVQEAHMHGPAVEAGMVALRAALAAQPLVAPAPDLREETVHDRDGGPGWSFEWEYSGNDYPDQFTVSSTSENQPRTYTPSDTPCGVCRGKSQPAPDSWLRARVIDTLQGFKSKPGAGYWVTNKMMIGLQAALAAQPAAAAAPESAPGIKSAALGLVAARSTAEVAALKDRIVTVEAFNEAALAEQRKAEQACDDLKKQLAEAETDAAEWTHSSRDWKIRAEKAEAADGNAGLRELRAWLVDESQSGWDERDVFLSPYKGDGEALAILVPDVHKKIDRILADAPQPERDDGPLTRYITEHESDQGVRDGDLEEAVIAELCRREKARGPK